MKTKRILSLLLALLMLLGSGAAFGTSAAADDIDAAITVHTANKIGDAPGKDFAQPGYWFVWVTGIYPGNIVKWVVKDSGDTDVTAKAGSANAAGFTVGLGLPPGAYTITVKVIQSVGTTVNADPLTPEAFIIPDRKKLRDALNGDQTVNLSILYDEGKWQIYSSAKQKAILAYEAYYLNQAALDAYADAYLAAQKDLPLKDQRLSEFLWHMLNLFYTVFRFIPFGNHPYYTL
ncbi:MAG: hypothetical protein LBT21_00535 [Oscillospiraceae bacterium]|nr:hypothetical protein [Oscillospiraceae bacterium]